MMKKSEKWTLIAVSVFPPVLIVLVLMFSGVNIMDFPLWFLIGMPILFVVLPFLYFFTRRFAQQKIYDKPVEKRKKPLLIAFGICILLTVLILVLSYYIGSEGSFLYYLVVQTGFLVFLFFVYFYPHLFKKKESQKEGNQNKSESR